MINKCKFLGMIIFLTFLSCTTLIILSNLQQELTQVMVKMEIVDESNQWSQLDLPLTLRIHEEQNEFEMVEGLNARDTVQKKEFQSFTASELERPGLIGMNRRVVRSNLLAKVDSSRSFAALSGSLTEASYVYDPISNTTNYKVRYYGVWNRVPLFRSTDKISVAIAGNGDHVLYNIVDSSCSLDYATSQGKDFHIETVIGVEVSRVGSKVTCNVPLLRSSSTPGGKSLALRSFTLYVEGQMQGNVTISQASANYEHRVLTIYPTIESTIGQSPGYGIGLTLNWRFEELLTKVIGSTNYSVE